ncbi:MAG: ankyrin repeat domain-containing protein, partial [Myxococcales bacterium]|nr:ankyrin repeat domain-containing protein [Myxococcales bacterium]
NQFGQTAYQKAKGKGAPWADRLSPEGTDTRELGAALVEAARNDRTDVITDLLAEGAPIDAGTERDESALIAATKAGSRATQELLLKAGADPNSADKSGMSALLWASELRPELALTLIDAGADLELRDSYGNTALIRAAMRRHRQLVGTLLDRGAKPHTPGQDWQALSYTLYERDPELSIRLIEAGADPRHRNKRGWSPLMLAAKSGLEECVVRLSTCAPDLVNAVNELNETALFLASEDGHASCVEQLIGAGADLEIADHVGRTPFLVAAANGHTEAARVLIQAGANAAAADQNGVRWTTAAHEGGHPRLVEALSALVEEFGSPPLIETLLQHGDLRGLLEQGEDPNCIDSMGRTALMWAVKRSRIESVRMLLKAGADPAMVSKKGETALSIAEARGHALVTRELRQAIAHRRLTEEGFELDSTSLLAACRSGQSALVEVFAEAGLDLNGYAEGEPTALVDAVARLDAESAATLLKAGADPNRAGSQGLTPAKAAARAGEPGVRLFFALGLSPGPQSPWGVSLLGEVLLTDRDDRLAAMSEALELGANPAARERGQETCLHVCARRGLQAETETLLERGADPESGDIRPLLLAIQFGHPEVALSLIRGGADASFAEPVPPVVVAARRGFLTVVDAVLRKGVNPNSAGADGRTALAAALEGGHLEVCERVLQAGASLRCVDSNGRDLFASLVGHSQSVVLDFLERGFPVSGFGAWTPLTLAVQNNREDLLALLIERGADPNQKNGDGSSALHWVRTEGAASSLLSAGAVPDDKDGCGRLPLEILLAEPDWKGEVPDALLASFPRERRHIALSGLAESGDPALLGD